MSYPATNMTAYPRCDSYFVDDSESRAYDPRELLKMEKRKRQDDMASELSRLTSDEYLEDVISHMRAMEDVTIPDVASIDIQEEIQWFMRPFLLDFLIEAHSFFHLLPETLFLAVNLLDRYCSRRVVYKRHYQLVGCAALLIAAKYGDRKDKVPTIRELKSMCCSLYEEDMFTQMEWHVLNTLDWVIGAPTVDSFIQIAMQDNYDIDSTEIEHMAWYVAENALYHKEFVSTKPSVMASASLLLARAILRREQPNESDYTHEEQLTLLQLFQILSKPSQALQRKYAPSSKSRTSDVAEEFVREQQLREQQSLVVRQPAPASPANENSTQRQNIYSTPVKAVQNPNTLYGYPTPPFTPDEGYYSQQQQQQCGTQICLARRPITPTPCSTYNVQPPVSYQQFYQ